MASDASETQVYDLSTIQVARRTTLKTFAAYLSQSSVQERVKTEPGLFAQIIELAVNDYGVRQISLAAELKITSAAISRWMASQSLPVAYGRPHILEVLARLIRENLADQDRMMDSGRETLAKGTVSAVAKVEEG